MGLRRCDAPRWKGCPWGAGQAGARPTASVRAPQGRFAANLSLSPSLSGDPRFRAALHCHFAAAWVAERQFLQQCSQYNVMTHYHDNITSADTVPTQCQYNTSKVPTQCACSTDALLGQSSARVEVEYQCHFPYQLHFPCQNRVPGLFGLPWQPGLPCFALLGFPKKARP